MFDYMKHLGELKQPVLIVEDGVVNVNKKKTEVKETITIKELKNCPRCGRKMSWFENEDGTVGQWCYYDQAPFLDPKLKSF